MGKQLTFYLLSSSGCSIKRFTVSASYFSVSCIIMLSGLAYLGYRCHGYHQLKHHVLKTEQLNRHNAQQYQAITRQKQQINNIIVDIRRLNSELADLKAFEEKLRIVANLEAPPSRETRFGVGGSAAADINAGVTWSDNRRMLNEKIQKHIQYLYSSSKDQRHRFKALFDGIKRRLTLLASTPSIRPTDGYVSSGFGYRNSPFTGEREFHSGLDLTANIGTAVVAPADGIVTFTGRKGILGKTVVLDHGHGVVTRYGHLHTILVRPGDRVKRMDKIARLGNSGRSTGPHLHYEVRLDGIPVNPAKYILN